MKTLKPFKRILLVIVIAGFAVTSCSKGDKGEPGPQGEKGTQGVAGPDGSTILSGTTAPAASAGKAGDFYINTATNTFYGPKTAAGWGNGTSIVGETGAKGTAGSKILSGTGTPEATTGATGDYYLDKNSSSLYGPKTSSGWGVALSLKGKTGTANVLYSGWIYAKNFRDSTIDNSAMHIADIVAPALTTDVLNNASINVYFSYGGGVFPLPHITNAGGKSSIINFAPRFKHFNITRYTLDNSNSINLSTVLQYRYVIIPGGVATSLNKKVNINNYEEVKRAYNIPD